MSKKQVTLPSRPPPPSVEEIVQDIEQSKNNDIVFQRGFSEEEDLMKVATSQSTQPSHNDAEAIYKQVHQFLVAIDKLESAPKALNDQSEHLKKLRVELEKSITGLKDQMRVVMESVNVKPHEERTFR